jgi:TRAP-type C4-dicarboxylate transport system permease small subunit
MHALNRVLERLALWLAYFSALLILSMSLWITYDVITRNLFGWSSPWAFDMSEYSLVWMTFLAAPWILLRDGHVRVEILVDALGPGTQRVIGAIVSIIGLIVCAVLAWRTGIAAVEYAQNDIRMGRIWNIPRIYPYAAVPFGAALLGIAFIARLGLYLGNRDPEAVLRARGAGGIGANPSGEV